MARERRGWMGSRRVLLLRVTTALLVGLLGIAGVPRPANAVLDTTATPLAMARAIASDERVVTGATFLSNPGPGANAVVTTPLAGMPTDRTTYLLLTTGAADLADDPNNTGSSGRNLGGPSQRGNSDFDVTILKIDLEVPSGANCLLGIDFRFLSEEYPEWVGSSYNDAFIVELDESTWTTSGSNVIAPRNFAYDPAGKPITINSTGVTSMTKEHATGTTYDGATPLLRAATPITPGKHSLFLSIFDQGDHAFDSAVMVDNLRVGRVATPATDCKSGAVPVGGAPSYVAFGDSYTTGESIRTCNYSLVKSKYGCQGTPPGAAPPARPYPEIVANALGHTDSLRRVGVWGYSLKRAAGDYPNNLIENMWPNQFSEVGRATQLVTGALGINDMHFSKVGHWLWQYRTDQAKEHAGHHIEDMDRDLDEMFKVLGDAKGRGVTVVVASYFNPYGRDRVVGGSTKTNGCGTAHGIGELITDSINAELRSRAVAAGLKFADFKTPFAGHGAGEDDPWVWAQRCDLSGVIQAGVPEWHPDADGRRGVQERFDPHANGKGTQAKAEAIMKAVNQ